MEERLIEARVGSPVYLTFKRGICVGVVAVCLAIGVCIVVALVLHAKENKNEPKSSKSALSDLPNKDRSAQDKLWTAQSKASDLPVITTESITEGTTSSPKYTNCADIVKKRPETRYKNGVYLIYPDMVNPLNVSCDMTTDSAAGWTVIHRRVDGKTDFDRNWNDYRNGFGDPYNEYWIGNEILHKMTFATPHVLRVDLSRFSGDIGYALYRTFKVENEMNRYQLTATGYTGNAGDGFKGEGRRERVLTGMYFTTKDRDNDPNSSKNCAAFYNGGWWHNACFEAFLNGPYLTSLSLRRAASRTGRGIFWYPWGKRWEALASARMMIRPRYLSS